MRKESFDRKNEKYGADRRFRTHPADRTKRRNVDGRYEEQKPKKRNADRGRVNESRRIKKLRKRKKARFLRKAVAAVFCVAAVIAAVLFLKERFLDENYRAGGLGQAVNGFLKEGKYLGYGLANLAAVVNPAVFVIGGGVSKAGEVLIPYIEKPYKERAFFADKNVRFVLAQLGNDAGICGSAKLVLDEKKN